VFDNKRNPQKLGIYFIQKYGILLPGRRFLFSLVSFLFSLLLSVSPVVPPNRGFDFKPKFIKDKVLSEV
jgi:hypothetical protein